MNTHHRIIPYFICSLAALFYLYDFLIRVLPGALAESIMIQYHIDAPGLGFLSSLFFLGYMTMQIPCGLLYDYIGPRLLLTIATFIAGLATFFFLATYNLPIAMIARLLMGLSSAFAYLGALVLAARWLPAKYFVITAGFIQLLGSAGAIIGEAPIAHLALIYSPYKITTGLAIIGIALAILFWVFIKDYPSEAKKVANQPNKNIIRQLKILFQNKANWAIALYSFAIWAPISIFGSLWGVPFLLTLYDISVTEAALLNAFVWIGVGLGGPLFGWFCNYTESRRIPLLIGAFIGVLSTILILYVPHPPYLLTIFALFLFGIAGSTQVVTFGVIQDNNPESLMGSASGFNNMAIVTGGVVFQPLVGILLNAYWDGARIAGNPFYSINDFRLALILLPMCFLISLITAIFWVRETHCRKQTN